MDIQHSNGDVVPTLRNLNGVASQMIVAKIDKNEVKSNSNKTFGVGIVDENEQTTIKDEVTNAQQSPDDTFHQVVDREKKETNLDTIKGDEIRKTEHEATQVSLESQSVNKKDTKSKRGLEQAINTEKGEQLIL